MNVIEKIDALMPRAASGTLPSCPTNAVSTSDASGSAASPARAGTARSRISRSCGLVRRAARRRTEKREICWEALGE
jgi:hypothetical protein